MMRFSHVLAPEPIMCFGVCREQGAGCYFRHRVNGVKRFLTLTITHPCPGQLVFLGPKKNAPSWNF